MGEQKTVNLQAVGSVPTPNAIFRGFMKEFHELTEEELKELEDSLYKRAVEKNRGTLWNVICAIRES